VSQADWALLLSLQVTQFQNGGHRNWLIPAYQAVARTGYDVSALATAAQAAATAAANSLAAQLALGLPTNGVGNEPMDLPRMVMFNSEAVRQWDMAAALIPSTQNAAYQIVEHDNGKLLLTTSGTNTWTLPLATDVWVGWTTRVRNRSGNNLTLARSGSDTINGAGSNLTVATASAILTVVCTSSTGFEVA
jgi:hypothetical protein